MTTEELIQVAQQAGFSGDNLAIAVAVAKAESGGNPAAIGDYDLPHAGCRSYGLWQINSCPDRDTSGPRADTAALLTPAGNAAAAYAISGGSNWHPWTTYNTGAYLVYLPGVKAAIAKQGGGSGGGGAVDASKYTQCIAQATEDYNNCVKNNPDDRDKCQQSFIDARAVCKTIFIDGKPVGVGDSSGCGRCTGLDTVPDCIACVGHSLTVGLTRIGVNIGLVALAAFGVYLFFQDDVNRAAKTALSVATKV